TNNVKTDYNFVVPEDAWDENSPQAHWRNRANGQPFFSVFNITVTHEAQIRSTEKAFTKLIAKLGTYQRHDPSRADPPPFLPDTPVVRRDWARYHDLISVMDKEVVRILRQLADDDLAEETIVFFFSDHGAGLPRCKRWIYDSGIHVPLVILFPEKYRHLAPSGPGSSCERLVSFVDFAPTMLSLANVAIPKHMQGTAFLGVRAGPPRQYVFAVRDRMDERYDMMRAVRDDRYSYIRNYFPHLPYAPPIDYMEQQPTTQEWRRLSAMGRLSGPAALFMASEKPAEELYDIKVDPHQLRNLVNSSAYRPTLLRMRREHVRWVRNTVDLGFLPEHDLNSRAVGTTAYQMARQEDGPYPLDEIFKVAWLMGRGRGHISELTMGLEHRDGASRFWAANGLVGMGQDARPAKESLLRALADSSPMVRIAAVEALCRLDEEKAALPVLVECLHHDGDWVRLAAANAIGRIGEKARPIRSLVRKVKTDRDTYFHHALTHSLAPFED
ncbi:MAG TPA: sulfatase, partial [Planctomycetaceae bacterium]|nr:sulfatase [Planctomycetaceae bacterium]